jgi:hypothetical protein
VIGLYLKNRYPSSSKKQKKGDFIEKNDKKTAHHTTLPRLRLTHETLRRQHLERQRLQMPTMPHLDT